MHTLIEHYGKVVVALAAVLATLLLTVAIAGIISWKTTSAVENIDYEKQIESAVKGAVSESEAATGN